MAALTFILLCALNILQNVLAHSNTEGTTYNSKHCIKITPEKEAEISTIIERITDALNDITVEFPHYDIRLIKLDIESHSEDEVEEKETQLQLTVNDCIIEENASNNTNTQPITEEVDIKYETPEERKEKNTDNQASKDTCILDNESAYELMAILNYLFTFNFTDLDDNSDGNATTITEGQNNSAISKSADDSGSNNTNTENSTVNSSTQAESSEKSAASVGKDNTCECNCKDDAKNNKDSINNADIPKASNTNKDEGAIPTSTSKKKDPEVRKLVLTELGQEVLHLSDRDHKEPFIVYVQEDQGRSEYIFL